MSCKQIKDITQFSIVDVSSYFTHEFSTSVKRKEKIRDTLLATQTLASSSSYLRLPQWSMYQKFRAKHVNCPLFDAAASDLENLRPISTKFTLVQVSTLTFVGYIVQDQKDISDCCSQKFPQSATMSSLVKNLRTPSKISLFKMRALVLYLY